MNIDWAKIVFSDTFYARLGAQVKRTFPDDTEADEAFNHVLDKLSENNWAKFSGYLGKSSPETYAHTLSTRLIVDYHRKLYGRLRPPAWISKGGDLWVDIWKELCLDRDAPEVIVNRYAVTQRDPVTIKHIINTIKTKLPWCGVSDRPVIEDNGEYVDGARAAADPDEVAEAGAVFVSMLLGDDEGLEDIIAEDVFQAMRASVAEINLSAQDRLMLRLHFCDGKSFAAIATLMGVPKHQPVRQIKQILKQARALLLKAGIDLNPA